MRGPDTNRRQHPPVIPLQPRSVGVSIAGMPSFCAADGTELAYHVRGEGAPLVCLPGGPGRASSYLGDLGGLSAHRRLILLNGRTTDLCRAGLSR